MTQTLWLMGIPNPQIQRNIKRMFPDAIVRHQDYADTNMLLPQLVLGRTATDQELTCLILLLSDKLYSEAQLESMRNNWYED